MLRSNLKRLSHSYVIESSNTKHVSVVSYSVMGVHPVAFSDLSLQLQEIQKYLYLWQIPTILRFIICYYYCHIFHKEFINQDNFLLSSFSKPAFSTIYLYCEEKTRGQKNKGLSFHQRTSKHVSKIRRRMILIISASRNFPNELRRYLTAPHCIRVCC